MTEQIYSMYSILKRFPYYIFLNFKINKDVCNYKKFGKSTKLLNTIIHAIKFIPKYSNYTNYRIIEDFLLYDNIQFFTLSEADTVYNHIKKIANIAYIKELKLKEIDNEQERFS